MQKYLPPPPPTHRLPKAGVFIMVVFYYVALVMISFNNAKLLKWGKKNGEISQSSDVFDIDVTSSDNFAAMYCSYTIDILHQTTHKQLLCRY